MLYSLRRWILPSLFFASLAMASSELQNEMPQPEVVATADTDESFDGGFYRFYLLKYRPAMIEMLRNARASESPLAVPVAEKIIVPVTAGMVGFYGVIGSFLNFMYELPSLMRNRPSNNP